MVMHVNYEEFDRAGPRLPKGVAASNAAERKTTVATNALLLE
jgi:hypothetical protein